MFLMLRLTELRFRYIRLPRRGSVLSARDRTYSALAPVGDRLGAPRYFHAIPYLLHGNCHTESPIYPEITPVSETFTSVDPSHTAGEKTDVHVPQYHSE